MLGISGLVLCFIAVPAILAIIFGVLALKEIKRSAGTVGGRGMAIAGVVLGIVGVIAGVIFWIAIRSGSPTPRMCSTSRSATAWSSPTPMPTRWPG